MRFGWIRAAAGLPSLDEQRATLAAHGVERDRIHEEETRRRRKVSADDPTPFDYALRMLRPGDELAVAEPAALASTKAGIIARVLAICTKRRGLYDCQAGGLIEGEAAAQRFIDRADRGLARARTAPARRVLAGAMRGYKLTDAKKRAALKDWRNPNLTAAQVAAKHGISRRQLFNALGKRFKESEE